MKPKKPTKFCSNNPRVPIIGLEYLSHGPKTTPGEKLVELHGLLKKRKIGVSEARSQFAKFLVSRKWLPSCAAEEAIHEFPFSEIKTQAPKPKGGKQKRHE